MSKETEKTPIYPFVISGLILLTYVWLAIPDSEGGFVEHYIGVCDIIAPICAILVAFFFIGLLCGGGTDMENIGLLIIAATWILPAFLIGDRAIDAFFNELQNSIDYIMKIKEQ